MPVFIVLRDVHLLAGVFVAQLLLDARQYFLAEAGLRYNKEFEESLDDVAAHLPPHEPRLLIAAQLKHLVRDAEAVRFAFATR